MDTTPDWASSMMVETDAFTPPSPSTSPPVLSSPGGWKWTMVWSWTIFLQLVFSVVGVLGNLLVILALVGRKTKRYSTDILVGALALADLLTSVIMIPIPIAVQVPDTPLGNLYCKVVYPSYLMWVFVFSSAYILTGMSVERFAAVVFPLHFHRIFTKERVYVFLLIVFLCAVPAAGITLTLKVIDNVCKDTKTDAQRVSLSIYLFTFRVGVPILVMVLTQTATAVSLHRQSRQLQGARTTSKGDTSSFHLVARNRIVKMTMAVVIIFILSLGPNQLVTMVTAINGTMRAFMFSRLYYILTLLAFINSCANPFIYAARYPKFRVAIKEIFTASFSKRNRPLFDHGAEQSQSNSMQSDNRTATSTISHGV